MKYTVFVAAFAAVAIASPTTNDKRDKDDKDDKDNKDVFPPVPLGIPSLDAIGGLAGLEVSSTLAMTVLLRYYAKSPC